MTYRLGALIFLSVLAIFITPSDGRAAEEGDASATSAESGDGILVEAFGAWTKTLGMTVGEARAFAEAEGYEAVGEPLTPAGCYFLMKPADGGNKELEVRDDTGCTDDGAEINGARVDEIRTGESLDPVAETARLTEIIGSDPDCGRVDETAAFCDWTDLPSLPAIERISVQLTNVGPGESNHKVNLVEKD